MADDVIFAQVTAEGGDATCAAGKEDGMGTSQSLPQLRLKVTLAHVDRFHLVSDSP